MTRRKQIYEGKAKVLFEGPEPGTIVQYFKDDATAFNNQKRGTITGKGVLNNRISEFLMLKIAEIGIPTHFVRRLNMREQLVRAGRDHPDRSGGAQHRRGLARQAPRHRRGHGARALDRRVLLQERRARRSAWCRKSTSPRFGWATTQDIDEIMQMSLRINDFLLGLFRGIGIKLVDFKLEFGRLYNNDEMRIVLADEISPDNCRLWDVKTNEKMDKDRFRQDLGQVEEAYQEVARRLGILPEGGPGDVRGPQSVQ